jgi:hypothetical protein
MTSSTERAETPSQAQANEFADGGFVGSAASVDARWRLHLRELLQAQVVKRFVWRPRGSFRRWPESRGEGQLGPIVDIRIGRHDADEYRLKCHVSVDNREEHRMGPCRTGWVIEVEEVKNLPTDKDPGHADVSC